MKTLTDNENERFSPGCHVPCDDDVRWGLLGIYRGKIPHTTFLDHHDSTIVFSHNFNNENHHDYFNRRYFDLYESGVPVLVLGRSWGQEAGHGMDGEAMMMVAKVMVVL